MSTRKFLESPVSLGDGSLAYKLATANGVKNPNLIYPGQVLSIPGGTDLGGYAPTPAPRAVQVATAVQEAAKQVDTSTAPAGTLDLSTTFSGSKSFETSTRPRVRACLCRERGGD